jgi:2,3-bisphosphoglycerate-independent phosphoglycerate mutase
MKDYANKGWLRGESETPQIVRLLDFAAIVGAAIFGVLAMYGLAAIVGALS